MLTIPSVLGSLLCTLALLTGAAPLWAQSTPPTAGMVSNPDPLFLPTPDDNVVLQWNNALLHAIRESKPGPTLVSRDIAVTQTAVYDAWAAYDAVAIGTRLGGTLRRPESERTDANREMAISFAAFRALSDLFPGKVAEFADLMTRLGYDPADTSLDVTTPQGVGNKAAAAVIEYRHQDGSNQLGDLHPGPYSDYTGYAPVNTPDQILDPNRWQPLKIPDGQGGFTVQKFTTPQWGLVKPFALTSGSQLTPDHLPYLYKRGKYGAPPDLYGTMMYIAQAWQLVDISAHLTDEQKMIAEYWADGPASELPPGHWCLIGQYVSRRDHHSLGDDAKMFLALGNAVMDAGIAAWDCKVHFDYVRPITAIHFLFEHRMIDAWAGPYQGTRKIKGGDWKPYQAPNVVTPPFAECISGHSTFSAAASEVLKRFTGSDAFGASVTFPAGSSLFEKGAVPASDVTLRWNTFTEAADQAGLSRLYGGIHFSNGDLPGRATGRKVGGLVFEKAESYFDGTAGS